MSSPNRSCDDVDPGPSGVDEHLTRWLHALPAAVDIRLTLAAVERLLILRALQDAQGVQAEAARNLGISRSDMTYKVRKYRLRA